MPAPTVNITAAAAPVPPANPTDTGVAFAAQITRTGPASRLLTTADACLSYNDWLSKMGGGSVTNGRLAYSVDSDWVEAFFRNGGSKLYPVRVVGPTPVKATLNLTGTGTTLIVTANEYGDLANTKKIAVINGPINGSGYRVVQLYENDGTTLIDQTAELNTQAGFSGLVLGATSNVPVTITLGGGSGLPTVLSATVLAGGTDDHANITQTQVNTALANLFIDLGPGQVAAPNWQTSTNHLALLSHAAQYNRFALCDPVDTTTKSTLLTNASTLKSTTNGAFGSLFHPWVAIPALSASGTGRSVPPSAFVAGRMNATDATDSPSQAPAGRWGILNYATSVNATWARVPAGTSDADVLSDAGVNLIVVKNGAVTIYDNLTLAPTGDEFQQIGVARWLMQTIALIRAAGDNEIFTNVTHKSLTAWKSSADGILLTQYTDGQLFGDLDDDRPETAFHTDVDTPNTTTTINAGQMNINVAARPVKGGRTLNVTISTVPINQPVA